MNASGHIVSHKTLELANKTNHEGFLITGGSRFLEREIDWNGDGIINKKMDFDGNGSIEKKKVVLGCFEGHDVFGTETNGERKILIPIKIHSPALLEPVAANSLGVARDRWLECRCQTHENRSRL